MYCSGFDSCRLTNIRANELVECSGPKSCESSPKNFRFPNVTIEARLVVCNGNGACGYSTRIHSACLVCANGGCGSAADAAENSPTCSWNGEPCPANNEIATCVVGASVNVMGHVDNVIDSTTLMVEIDVKTNPGDATLFHGKIQLRGPFSDIRECYRPDAYSSYLTFQMFDSASIFLSYVQKECIVIKGTGTLDKEKDEYEFSLKLCEASNGSTRMDMTIAESLRP